MGLTPIRVAQLNSYIGRVLKNDPLLSDVSVIGEISNLTHHSSGHIYFSLKDSSSTVRCFLSARTAPHITCPLQEGMEVIASGFISVYERGGSYSLTVMDLQAGGMGQLAMRFEQLKKKLAAEGLFDPGQKQAIPVFPRKVAVVTSPTGAAVRDILKIITSKNDVVDILICPVLVQGPSAPGDIASAIDELNADHPDIDVIIAGRGGGSMEELWAFNEEVVARSIYRSRIPVISAVGHETDVTIADFVADLRAETPTAAADRAVPDTGQLRLLLDGYKEEMTNLMEGRIRLARQRLQALDPAAFGSGIRTRIEYEQVNLDRMAEDMGERIRERLEAASHHIDMLRQIIGAANPYDILRRGYSMITDPEGALIRSVEDLSEGQAVSIRMGDGIAEAQITGLRKEELK